MSSVPVSDSQFRLIMSEAHFLWRVPAATRDGDVRRPQRIAAKQILNVFATAAAHYLLYFRNGTIEPLILSCIFVLK
jgi:hypothetical protein